MQKPIKVQGKYDLKTIHQEIDLYDRKLAHLELHEVFATQEARDLALNKMVSKRELLVKSAKRLAAEGIEFDAADLPRSFRVDTPVAIAAE